MEVHYPVNDTVFEASVINSVGDCDVTSRITHRPRSQRIPPPTPRKRTTGRTMAIHEAHGSDDGGALLNRMASPSTLAQRRPFSATPCSRRCRPIRTRLVNGSHAIETTDIRLAVATDSSSSRGLRGVPSVSAQKLSKKHSSRLRRRRSGPCQPSQACLISGPGRATQSRR